MDTDPTATPQRGRLVVVVGPSGVGKGTVIQRAMEIDPSLWLSVSVTARAPRTGDRDGVTYSFVSRDEFDRLVQADAFLEWAEFSGHPYGTPRAAVEEHLARGQSVLLEIDLAGARQVRARVPDALLVFLAPPSFAELENRLRGRGTESETEIQRRLSIARTELDAAGEFDEVVVNTDVEDAASRLVSLAHT